MSNSSPSLDTVPSVEPTAHHEPPPAVDTPLPLKKSGSKSFFWVILVLVVGLLFVGWYFITQYQTSSKSSVAPSPIVHTKKLIIGTDATLPPMEYMQDGKYIGYDIDLANALAQQLNTEVEIKQIQFDDLFTSLEQKKIDIIISAVTITDERKAKYEFSDPYLNAGQVIITKKDNTIIKTTADLKGKKIGVQTGTTNEKQAVQYTSGNLVVRFSDFEQAAKALINGQVDAVFNDLPGAKGTITKNPSLKIASDPFTNEYYGIVFRKEDPSIKQINDALSAIRIKGILTDFKQKWLD